MKTKLFTYLPMLAVLGMLAVLVPQFVSAEDVGESIKEGAVTIAKMHSSAMSYADVSLTSSQMNTLNATPITVVAAPGLSSKVTWIEQVLCFLDAGATPFELGSGTIDFRYGSSGGGLGAQVTNAFTELSADSYYAAPMLAVTAAANTAIVAYASADVTAGDGQLNCRVIYRVTDVNDI